MDHRPGGVFHQLLRAHHNASMAALASRGVGDISSPHLLMELARYPNSPDQAPTQKELADRLHIAPPTIAASLKRLERQGYVARRTDEKDSRRNRISITRKGRDALETGLRAFQQVDDHMYHGFSPEEREQVYQFHRRMLDNLYQIGGRRWSGEPPFPPDGPFGGVPPEPLEERKCDPC